ncbi:restriction endonuclease subunit S [Vibrio vulnificus]|uniref:restriction endonuclease subunit S n=1 Tax=Vibrio vulnificus TaxID=672 RepID=UPI004058E252
MGNDYLVKIGDIATVFDGPHATPTKIEHGPYFLSISSLEAGQLDLSKSARLSEEQFDKWTRRVTPQEGDVLFSYETRLGEAALMPKGVKACLGRRMGLLRPALDKVLPEYLLYAYMSPMFQQEIKKRTIHGATVDRISLKELPDFNIRIPPLSEQARVVNVLKSLNQKLSLNRQINQTLEQMAQTLFKSWFVDFDPVMDNALDAGNLIPDELQHRAEARKAVRESEGFKPLPDDVRQLFPDAFEESELGWVPKGWVYQSFGSLLASTIGGDWGKDVQDEKHTVQSRIVRGTDIPDLISGQLSSAPLRWVEPKKLKSRQIERGDIIIEVSGGSPKQPTGRSIFMTDSMLARLGSIIEPASFCRRFKPSSFNIGLLASLHLQKIYADGKTWEYQNQSTGIANFQTKFFLEAEMVLIPSEPVLEAFCRIVTPLVEKSQNNEQIALAKLRDTLLPKLISGELRLDDIEAAVEQETVSA